MSDADYTRPAPPRNKLEFYDGMRTLLWGNYPRTWDTLEEAICSDHHGTFGIRTKTGINGPTVYHIQKSELVITALRQPIDIECLSFTEGMPDSKILWQGDCQLDFLGDYWFVAEGSDIPNLTHREACGKWMLPMYDMSGYSFLQKTCWPKSWDMLHELLQTRAIIEIGIYDTEVGQLPGHNTIIWEVRNGY